MYSLIIDEVRKKLSQVLVDEVLEGDVVESRKADLASPIAFRLASKHRRSPVEIASEAAEKIKPFRYIKEIWAEGGYINFAFNYSEIISPLIKEIREKKGDYGRGKPKNKKIILEHTSVNPSGPLHVGRIRNCFIGDSLARVMRFSGYEVETHYFVNDVGKQIAIIASGFAENLSPDEAALNNYLEYKDKEDFQIFFEYVAANRRYEEDEGFALRVQELVRKAEGGDASSLKKITDVAKHCLRGQSKVYERLGVRFDFFDYESKYIESGEVSRVIEFLKNTRYFEDTDRGLGLNLKEFGVERREGASIIARRDGTSVYLTRDIAYHLEKAKRGDIIINVLGEDHKFEFFELKTILEKIYGVSKPIEVVHYSFVSFEGMELSTRKGQTAPVDKLLDEAVRKAEEEIRRRGIASEKVAPVIAYGAVKYHLLKTSPQKPITFRWSEALSFDGEAAPYIQYAHARCCSILEKAQIDLDEIVVESIKAELSGEEEDLVRMLLRFPLMVENTVLERKPSIMAAYAYELASSFSRFYKSCQVIVEEEETRNRRLLLVDSTRQVLVNALSLLGIDAPEKM